ncbi:MAG: response regulator transcription factor [Cellulomonas sp.]|nr:response regulator transcription factor [Cellulomonas sp.]
MTGPVRVVIVDDQEMVRTGLRVILDHTPDIEVVGEACDGLDAYRVVRDLVPDVVLMDIRMPRSDGVEATGTITGDPALADVQVIALTTFDDDEYLAGALRAGVAGFLLKDSSPVELLAAIRRVHAGDAMLDPALTRRVLDQWVTSGATEPGAGSRLPLLLDRLSPRETEVWRLVATGASNREIARELYLTEGTVKTHVHALLTKLDTPSRAVLVTLAYESGFVSPGSST